MPLRDVRGTTSAEWLAVVVAVTCLLGVAAAAAAGLGGQLAMGVESAICSVAGRDCPSGPSAARPARPTAIESGGRAGPRVARLDLARDGTLPPSCTTLTLGGDRLCLRGAVAELCPGLDANGETPACVPDIPLALLECQDVGRPDGRRACRAPTVEGFPALLWCASDFAEDRSPSARCSDATQATWSSPVDRGHLAWCEPVGAPRAARGSGYLSDLVCANWGGAVFACTAFTATRVSTTSWPTACLGRTLPSSVAASCSRATNPPRCRFAGKVVTCARFEATRGVPGGGLTLCEAGPVGPRVLPPEPCVADAAGRRRLAGGPESPRSRAWRLRYCSPAAPAQAGGVPPIVLSDDGQLAISAPDGQAEIDAPLPQLEANAAQAAWATLTYWLTITDDAPGALPAPAPPAVLVAAAPDLGLEEMFDGDPSILPPGSFVPGEPGAPGQLTMAAPLDEGAFEEEAQGTLALALSHWFFAAVGGSPEPDAQLAMIEILAATETLVPDTTIDGIGHGHPGLVSILEEWNETLLTRGEEGSAVWQLRRAELLRFVQQAMRGGRGRGAQTITVRALRAAIVAADGVVEAAFLPGDSDDGGGSDGELRR